MKSKNREAIVHSAVKEGWLEIHEDGSVWRVARRHKSRWGGAVTVTPVTPHRIDAVVGAGYRNVHLMVDGKQFGALAHRLVWFHFYGPIPPTLTINHKNGQKGDNRPENLEVVTYAENTKHAYRTGLMDEHGERNPAAKLTNLEVAAIRVLYSNGGITQQKLADQFGVKFQQISKIVRGDRRPRQEGATADYSSRRNNPNRERNHLGQFH
jgi:hypothetical protein